MVNKTEIVYKDLDSISLPQVKKDSLIEYSKKYYTQNILEFDSDYLIIKYLKGQLSKFINNKKINKRLVLNYIIILSNVIRPPIVLVRILFLECNKELWGVLATFLKFLNLLPKKFLLCENIYIETDNIVDYNLLDTLNDL